jgi:hypothetical protein
MYIDEESYIQVLNQSHPWLSLKKGRFTILRHDYKHNGPMMPFAVLSMFGKKVDWRLYAKTSISGVYPFS